MKRFSHLLGKVIHFVDLKKAYGITLFYGIALIVIRLKVGIIWGGDTSQYIEKSVIRPPIYPLLLDLFSYLFGAHEYIALVFFQLIFVLIAAFHLSNTMRKKFHLLPITFTLLSCLLSVPLLSSSVALGLHGEIGNIILTEAISYGLFLFAVAFLVRILFISRPTDFIIFLSLIVILTLTRTQMIFLYVIAIVLILSLYLKRDIRIPAAISLFIVVLVIFLCAELGERLYHKLTNNYFGKISLTESHLLVGAIYVSDKQTFSHIDDIRDRRVLEQAYEFLEDHKLLAKQRFEIGRRMVDLYNDNFAVILGPGLMSSFRRVYAAPPWGDDMLLQVESFSRRVAPVLVIHHYKDVAKLMLLKFLYTLNFREGFFFATFLLFPFVKFTRELKLFSFFVLLMLLTNRLMMTPIIYIGDRYLFYTDILEYVALVIMAEEYLRIRSTKGDYSTEIPS